MQIHKALAPILALGLLFGCSSSSSKSSTPAPGTVTVYLGSDYIPKFDSIMVSIQKLEWSSNGTDWADTAMVPKSFDLVQRQNGYGVTSDGLMVKGVVIAPTTIAYWRITWDTVSNPTFPLKAASFVSGPGIESGANLTMPVQTVLPGKVVVSSGVATTAELMITGAGAVQNTGVATTTSVPIYSFQNATGVGYDLSTTCSLTGTLTSSVVTPATGIANVEVYAETVSKVVPSIVRRALTDGAGNFTLDALPISNTSGTPITYYVVSQPFNNAGTTLVDYPPQASAPFSTSTPGVYPTATSGVSFSLDFPALQAQASTGNLQVSIAPASLFQNASQTVTQSTWVEVSQPLPTPANQTAVVPTLIIRSANADTATATATTVAEDNVTIADLPTLVPYTVTAQRATSKAPGSPLAAPVPQIYSSTPTLTGGQVADVAFTYTASGAVPAS